MEQLNVNTKTYEFEDLDLEAAVNCLNEQLQTIVILKLMGHDSHTIGTLMKLSYRTINRKLKLATEILRDVMFNARR